MFAVATGNQKTFEVGIYNKEVRNCVKENNSHLDFGDEWADVHYQNIVAVTEAEALTMVTDRYPADKGFVVTSLKVSNRRY
ncbi:hypothetical protein RYZ26_03010 [Terasakiella sp. A23]|uniref:hypothetical protein n=1 Tax=Terasakiella sp. FCG-A23 TaxID=3080561 RepID=UPI002953FE99|nr:hypothetical protein [Terasakiella sp. A23]MDV7338550.1 hypothetical protein [Terasakiella sp. A23]